jgi:hypothetical protein
MDMDTAANRSPARPVSYDSVGLDARAAFRVRRRDRAIRAAATVGGVASLSMVLLGPAQPAAVAAGGTTIVAAVDTVQPAVTLTGQPGTTSTTRSSA